MGFISKISDQYMSTYKFLMLFAIRNELSYCYEIIKYPQFMYSTK